MSVIIEVTPFQYIGIATGLLGPTFATASFLGPVLGGVITTWSSWRWVFFVKYVPNEISISTNVKG